MKKVLILGIAAVVLLGIIVLVVSLFSSSPKKTVDNTLTIWSPFDEGDTLTKISSQYLTDNPTVKLSFRYVQATDAAGYEAKVVDAIANGSGPDIWFVRTDWLAKHQAKLIPATNYVTWSTDKKNEVDAAAEYFGAAIAAQNSRGGHLYGFPISVDSLALYINTKVLSDVQSAISETNSAVADKLGQNPTTWADVATFSQLMTKKDSSGRITTAGLALGTVGNTYAPVDIYNALLAQYGGSLFTADEKSVAIHLVNGQNQTPGTQALTLESSFAKPGDANYSWNSSLGDPVTAFVNNKLGMMIGYSSLSKEIIKAKKDFDSVKIVPLPQVNDPAVSNKRVDGANYWTMVVSKNSQKPATAWTYLKSLGSGGSDQYGQLTGKPSFGAAKDASLNISAGSLGETQLFSVEASFAPPVFKPDWQVTDAIIQDALNQALLPNQSAQAAIDSAAERLKALLAS